MPQYSETQLLEHLRALNEELGHPPSTTDMETHGRFSRSVYYQRFGSWGDALEKAGLQASQSSSRIPTEQLEESLVDLTESLGHPPRTKDIKSKAPHAVKTYRTRFGSLSAAVEAADISPRNIPYQHTRTELLDELEALADQLGHSPSTTDLRKHSDFALQTYLNRFESWENAIEEAGLDPDSITYRLNTDDLLAELRFLAEKLNKTPAKWDMKHHGKFSPAPYLLRFGTWADALEAADMNPAHTDKTIPTEALEADLRRLVDEFGTPSWREISEHGNFAVTTYTDRFGSLEEALDIIAQET